jgi:hypothetical protein
MVERYGYEGAAHFYGFYPENGNPEQFLKSHGVHLDLWRDSESLGKKQEMPEFFQQKERMIEQGKESKGSV